MSSKLGMLWSITRGERRGFICAGGAIVLGISMAYVNPLVVRAAIDGLLRGDADAIPAWARAWVGRVERPVALAAAAGVMLAVSAWVGGFAFVRTYLSARASEGVVRRLRGRLYDHLQRLPTAYHDNAETGDLVQRCSSDVETLRVFLSGQVVELARATMLLSAAAPVMLWLDWRMALAASALLPVIVAFAFVFFRRVKRSFEAMDQAEGAMSSTLQEGLTGIRVVRAFGRQDYERARFASKNDDHRKKHLRNYLTMAGYWALSDLLVFGQMGLALFTGAYLVSIGEEQGGISVGTMVAFWNYVGLYIWPVRQMGRILSELGKALVSAERVQQVLEVEPERDSPDVLRAESLPARAAGAIEFRDVSFGHREGAAALRGVSFRVEPGETLAILGPSGAGKSTIMALLLRFYEYTQGSILLDGVELRRWPRAQARAQFGTVLQEPFLFSGTIGQNLRLGVREGASVSEQQIAEAAIDADLHETVRRFETGYDTVVGERGVTLSGGQRQRVALARVLIQRPPVLLLDDAFSAVDTRTEKTILRALRRRHAKQTTLIIAHRLSTLRLADRVLVLEEGRVTALGTHEELLAGEGLYRRLWDLQHGGAGAG